MIHMTGLSGTGELCLCGSPTASTDGVANTIKAVTCPECMAIYRDYQTDVYGEEDDPVNHPKHYTSHPSGIECIQVTEYMNFCLGSAVKYIWRAGLKNDAIEDLKKAAFYINREIERRESQNNETSKV